MTNRRSAFVPTRRAASVALAASLFALTACNALRSGGDEAPPIQFTQPTAQHQWLDQLVGEWDFESSGMSGEGEAPATGKGTMDVQSLGGLWILGDGRMEMNGGSMRAVLTLGYDEGKQRYVGTWIDSVLAHMWRYEGQLDATGRILPLEAEGPSFTEPGAKATFRDTIEIVGPDHWRMSSSMKNKDGSWTTFMTADYHRRN